jgi:RNA polymerase sigma-70 factor (ECF subfamily)
MHVSLDLLQRHNTTRWTPKAATQARMSADQGPAQFEALIVAVADQRDRQAFTTLFAHFAPRVKAYLTRGGMSSALAEDLMQDVLLTVWNKAALFDPRRASAQAWIFGIARNLKIDTLRRGGLAIPGPDPSEEIQVPLADTLVAAEQTSRSIRRAIDALPAEQVEILRLAFFEDLTHGEIETALGVPLGTVKSRLRLAMAKLRRALKEDP